MKSAEGGLPTSIGASLSALANLPGGGILLLGLSAEEGFAPVGLRDPQTLKQSLGAKARSLAPPVQLSISDATVGGEAVIVAEVAECDPTLKPCRLSPNGKAFVRSYDGDFEISEQEVQGFLVSRGTPRADRLAVPGTTTADLHMEVVEAWRQILRANHDPLSKFEGDELFRRSGIIGPQGELTRAGLLTFGLYPQQHLPRFTLHVTSRLTTADNQRAGHGGARCPHTQHEPRHGKVSSQPSSQISVRTGGRFGRPWQDHHLPDQMNTEPDVGPAGEPVRCRGSGGSRYRSRRRAGGDKPPS